MFVSKHLVMLTLMVLLSLASMTAGGPKPGLDVESVADKIMKKIASAFEKSVIRAGNTCGLPKINNVMKNLTLNEGDTANFHCSVDMKCMVSYIQWYHEPFNGTLKLLRTGASSGDPYSYFIKDVHLNDEGFYMCVAGNTLGETTSLATLEIAGAATIYMSLIYKLLYITIFINLLSASYV